MLPENEFPFIVLIPDDSHQHLRSVPEAEIDDITMVLINREQGTYHSLLFCRYTTSSENEVKHT